MFRKYFNPREAKKTLPLVKPIVQEILDKGKRLRSLLESNHGKDISPECRAIESDIASLMEELEEIGCFYKDWNFEIGLVDFPAIIEEEEVLLCWKSDEPDILWYHSIEGGFSGRRPISQKFLT